jgi:membrane-associated phospholipid phosphatase
MRARTLVLTFIFVAGHNLHMTLAWNQSLFLWLNAACAALPDWLWASLTITGHTSVVFALLGLLLLPQIKRTGVITGFFVAAILGGAVSTLVKESLQIPRPPAVLAEVQFHLIGHKLHLVSFPSGHTLTAFGVATLLILGLQLRGWRLAGMLVLASLIGLSRIAVGAHWPLDVLGGAALGTACGWGGWQAAQWLHQKRWTQSVTYSSCQAGIILLVSASLFATQMGYPGAIIWQMAAATVGIFTSLYTLLLLLKSAKLALKG